MNIASWVQTHWLLILEALGGIHVILNVLGKLTNSKAIQGLDNTLFSFLSALGIKLPNDAASSIKAPNA